MRVRIEICIIYCDKNLTNEMGKQMLEAGTFIRTWIKIKEVGDPDQNGEYNLTLTFASEAEQDYQNEKALRKGTNLFDLWHQDFTGRVLKREALKDEE